MHLLKSCFKALHCSETWPDYLKLLKQVCARELRSSNSIRLIAPTENGTFQDNASKLFNTLPEDTRKCNNYRTFIRLAKEYLYGKALHT